MDGETLLIRPPSPSFLQGALLADAALLSTLDLDADTAFVAYVESGKRKRAPVQAREPLSPTPPPRAGGLDTLLPGFALRPNATPPERPPLAEAPAEEGGFERAEKRRAPEPAPADGGVVTLVSSDDEQDALVASPAESPAADASTSAPLPCSLAALETRLLALMAAHDYLTRRHVAPTWRLLALAVAGARGAPAVSLADARAGAALAPELVAVRPGSTDDETVIDFSRPRTAAEADPGRLRPRGELRTATLRAALAAAADAAAGGGPDRWDAVHDSPLPMFTLAAAAARAGAAAARPAAAPRVAPDPALLLASFKASRWYADQITATVTLPAAPADVAPCELAPAPRRAVAALLGRDADAPSLLYRHQADAVRLAAEGRSFIVAAPTASGKSVCFLAPLAAALAADPGATAVLLFPTKALAQDQLPRVAKALKAALEGVGGGGAAAAPSPLVAVFDGDTPPADRPAILAAARVLLTNPDMLHRTILPASRSDGWRRFLSGVALVAVDEAHAYAGAFGAHAALVLRRLRRVVESAAGPGARPPLFIALSATVGNARQHAAALLGDPDVALVAADGSPAGAKTFVLWNPPLLQGKGAGGDRGGGGRPPRPRPEPAIAAAHAATAAAGGARASDRGLLRVGAVAGGGAESVFGGRAGGRGGPAPPVRDAVESAIAVAALPNDDGAGGDAAAATPPTPPTPRRASAIVEAGLLLAACVRAGARTLAFCGTRKVAELVASHAQAALGGGEGEGGDAAPSPTSLASRVACYRGGYTPAARRSIEAALFGGGLLGVATTNALELGVDVGDLDATLHVGVPPTAASLWQQVGRAGRRGGASLHVLVARDSPLDQFYCRSPGALLSRAPEAVACAPDAPGPLSLHVAAAAAELPLNLDGDAAFFGPALAAAAADLEAAGLLSRHPAAPQHSRHRHYCGAAADPAAAFGLRTADADKFAVVDADTNETIEEIEAGKAFFHVYDGAVVLHAGVTYLCTRVGVGERTATVKRQARRLNYYTTPVDVAAVHVTGSGEGAPPPPGAVAVCPALVTTRVLAFLRVARASGRAFDRVPLALPDVQFATEVAHLVLPRAAMTAAAAAAGADLPPALHAAAHALRAVAPAALAVAPQDVGCECGGFGAAAGLCRLLIFDAGATGAARAAAARFGRLLADALALIDGCPCDEHGGCPSCVQASGAGACPAYNEGLAKAGGAAVLRAAGALCPAVAGP